MRPLLYVLDDQGEPLGMGDEDTLVWAKWFEEGNRQVALDTVEGAKVSTVFLGSDHGLLSGPPVLWETMVFGPTGIRYDLSRRYTSKAAALKGHAEVCAALATASPESRGRKRPS